LFGGLFGGAGVGSSLGKSAMGNVFDQGRIIHPYALGGIFSDIVTRPTMFPMANGAGLMGEAGPEAIMPLKRGSDGKLGVSGAGGGDNFTFAPVYQIDARGSQMTEAQFTAILDKNNKKVIASLPDRFAKFNRDPRARG
jgi:lambda family phage tail tape measure protein